MGATAFTHPLAKRIVASNAWVEQQRGIEGGNEEAPYSLQSGSMLIRTGTSLPTGYTGAMAVLGEIVERTFSGEYLPRMPIWIRDINGGTLAANTVYQGVSGGSFTQDVTVNGIVTPTTYGLYLVQIGGSSVGSTAFEPFTIQSASGFSLLVYSIDLQKSATIPNIIGPNISQVLSALQLRPTGMGAFPSTNGAPMTRYKIDQFSFAAEARYYTSTINGDIVACRAPGVPGNNNPYFFDAVDTCRLVRKFSNVGNYCSVILQINFITNTYSPGNYNNFGVIAANGFDYFSYGISTGIGTGISGV